ncbi:MAG: hypothetical protein HY651_04965 [Acidobacteria bacterium]|nr:hypothetical protein [Acidobacteriota bacterium]
MLSRFACPYLKGEVELTEEWKLHIAERHPDLLPGHWDRVAESLQDPDQVRRSTRFGNARLFSRRYSDARRGKYVVVVVVSELDPEVRHWIITAYQTRQLAEGVLEWKRD